MSNSKQRIHSRVQCRSVVWCQFTLEQMAAAHTTTYTWDHANIIHIVEVGGG
jgi:hypothetical protein